jgi:hypothetical protein
MGGSMIYAYSGVLSGISEHAAMNRGKKRPSQDGFGKH